MALLSITNAIFAHIFVATAVLFPPKSQQPPPPLASDDNGVVSNSKPVSPAKSKAAKQPIVQKKKKEKKQIVQHKIETKTVYTPPTQADIDEINAELEDTEPLPTVKGATTDKARYGTRVQSVVDDTNKLFQQREDELITASKEINELIMAHQEFATRFEQDTWRESSSYLDDESIVKELRETLPSLTEVVGRMSFVDLSREELINLFTLAMEDLRGLLSVYEEGRISLFLNVNNTLLTALVNDNASSSLCQDGNYIGESTTCLESYLALDEGAPSSESTPPKKKIGTKKKKSMGATVPSNNNNNNKPAPPEITSETARESDLYELVENIKHILSRRVDLLSSVKLDEEGDEPIPSPVSEETISEMRSQLKPVVTAIEQKWISVLTQENQIREYWLGRTETLTDVNFDNDDSDNGDISTDNSGPSEGEVFCATSKLVEDLVKGGFESLRTKRGLKDTLTSLVMMDAAEENVMVMADLMQEVDVSNIAYDGDNGDDSVQQKGPTTSSSWKTGKKSISYVVDTPLLHRGIANWIDSFIDAVSGYNDNVDALIDWVMGEEETGSVGTSVAGAVSKLVRKVPFVPKEYQEKMKKSGILGGRTRSVLEE